MNLFDVMWKTYSVAGRLPLLHEARAPFDANPVAAADGRVSNPGGAGTTITAALSRSVTAAAKLIGSVTEGIARWHKRRVTIRELSALDDRMLKDIGLHRSEIRAVAGGLLNSARPSPVVATRRVETLPAKENRRQIAANDNDPRVAA